MEITTGNWNKFSHLQHIPPYVRIIDENTIMYLRFLTTDTGLLIESSLSVLWGDSLVALHYPAAFQILQQEPL